MNNNKHINQILEKFYKAAIKEIKKDNGEMFLKKLNDNQQNWLFRIISNAESFKAIVTVLATSLVKKIENPKQDIRYHKNELKGGYSGRTFDTKFITPFFKKYFPRFSMKESGWLTRSIEQPHPFTIKFPGKIRNKDVKQAFLQILYDVEENKVYPENYLTALLILLAREIIRSNSLLLKNKLNFQKKNLTINLITESLKEHFFTKYKNAGASRLPVIAIYSIYEILLRDIARYKGKKLLPLKSHVASDIKAKEIGDVEIIDEKRKSIFEGVEIKHGIPIDFFIVRDACEKIKDIPIERYYILTTAEPNIKKGEEQKVLRIVNDIRKNHGCEIVVNGLIYSLKYYLRLVQNLDEFMTRYSKNIKIEASVSTVVKIEHLEKWNEIVKRC
ncbi:DNA methyltransferase [Patescibacteria group bacterium]|nr:DNA methyltransferase [Patescibacteria group bacterium]MBU4056416.1 DNA methyltransferase [Patescibacteria group bacterium]MBU4368940.1 DNA methyltransferase [Patescibacteria group bacterium]